MKIILVSGSWEEMGKSFAKAISPNAHDSINYLIKSPYRVSTHILQANNIATTLLAKLLDMLLHLKTTKLRDEDKKFLTGMAKELGLKPSSLLKGLAGPDFYNYLLSFSDNLLRRSIPHIPLGCSSIVAHSDATSSGSLYHCRNLDYIGGKYWEKGHCLLIMKPNDGTASINLTTDGIYAPGITSVNEEGIGLSLHLNFTRNRRFPNVPVTTLASKIISQAKSISDAIDILRKEKPMSGWTFIVSDAKRKEAVAIELSAERLGIVPPENNLLWYTNMYLSPNLQETEYAPSYVWVQNNNARYNRLKTLLLKNHGKLNSKSLIKIMGDSFDLLVNQEVALGDTVSNAANVSSAVMSWDEDEIWVSDSTVPPNRGRFLKFRISELFTGKAETLEETEGNMLKAQKEEAFRQFVLACFEWEEKADPQIAHNFVSKAINKDPEEPLYRLVRGWFLAKMKKFHEAIDEFKFVASSNKVSPLRKAQALLWLARMYDLTGERSEAITYYRESIKTCPAYDIQKLAWNGIKKPYKASKFKLTDILPFVVDAIEA
ncbi:hypothetical protein TST_0562 [Thermosulfidibacter takaii ABI70S6]|uniref:Peptidase C45 hydrolase domain-containing protein n=1 Tax=Thermosulfidibacter takaii (strain DSM 17441 / JCM 13301 / NBRC 103674 / ABI70S6) TaxID=1298851 RepID=A0A0S3QSP4_THET7|nr:C45 family autoproteolytic acyltransferase/hydolase [Thermosulfidibacter takaii]BAT71368.1 hypothetical protein TST_0562 [Thermosulfidibacter takaii ABI70S6]